MLDLNSFSNRVYAVLPSGESLVSREKAALFLASKIIDAGRFGKLPYDEDSYWLDIADRSRGRYFHGLIFVGDWIATIREDRSGDFGDVALAIVRNWARKNSYAACSTDSMAYHDETTAQRLNMLIALEQATLHHIDEPTGIWLHEHMRTTAALLAKDEFHSTGNNHGMFQDQALRNFALTAHWLSDTERYSFFSLACDRLKNYFELCFTNEGIHIENSPTYHLMICRNIKEHSDIISFLRERDTHLFNLLLSKAAGYAKHVIMPNGMFPPISDTQQVHLRGQVGRVFDDAEFDYAATRGTAGIEPRERSFVAKDSGYAVYRSSWCSANASYILFTAAYHANYHKHSDDLSLLIRSGGKDLISEAGAYGYNYKDPLTVYGYSQYAHNNVVVNGKSTRRTDANGQTVKFVEGDVRSDGFHVKAVTGRLPGVTHCRDVEVRESGGFPITTVVDTLESNSSQRYEMFWNIGPDIDVSVHSHGFELFFSGRKLLDAHIQANVSTNLSIHRGEMSPKVLGWRFPEFGKANPTNVVRLQFSGHETTISTVFKLAGATILDHRPMVTSTGWKRPADNAGVWNGRPPTPVAELFFEGASQSLTVVASSAEHVMTAFYLYKESAIVDRTEYSDVARKSWLNLASGNYRVRVFQKFRGSTEISKSTTAWSKVA